MCETVFSENCSGDLGTRQVVEHLPGLLEHLHFPARRRALGQLGCDGPSMTLRQLSVDIGNQIGPFIRCQP